MPYLVGYKCIKKYTWLELLIQSAHTKMEISQCNFRDKIAYLF